MKKMSKVLPSYITIEQLDHLRSLVRKFDDMQDAREKFENQIRSIKDEVAPKGRLGFILEEGIIKGIPEQTLDTLVHRGKPKKVFGLTCYEDTLVKQMKPILESHRLYVEFLNRVKGIGPLSAARIIAYFEPYWAEMEIVVKRKKKEKGRKLPKEIVETKKLYPPKSRSSLGKISGYAVQENTGRADRMTRGQKLLGNPRIKSIFWIIFGSLLKQKGKCYEIWQKYHEEAKIFYPDYLLKWYGAKTRKEVKKLHPKTYIPNTLDLSRRRFIKTFISIIWEAFQELYKLPIPPPQHAPDQPLTEKEWIHPQDICE